MCNCRNKTPSVPKNIEKPIGRTIPLPKSTTPIQSKTASLNTSNKFCQLCGWLIKAGQSFDSKSKTIVSKLTCTNHSCRNHI